MKENKKPYGFIYMTICLVNGMYYFGQRKYSKGWKTYLGSGVYFTNAVKKYGRKSFVRLILEDCYSAQELDKAEKEYTILMDAASDKNCYNLIEGGANSHVEQWPEEVVEKRRQGQLESDKLHRKKVIIIKPYTSFISIDNLDYIVFDSITKCAEYLKTKTTTLSSALNKKQFCKKQDVWFLDDLQNYIPAEVRKKQKKENYSIAHKGQEAKNKKQVYCFELDKIFNSGKEADRYLKVHDGTVCLAINRRHRVHGYEFCFLENKETWERLPSSQELAYKAQSAGGKVSGKLNGKKVINLLTWDVFNSASECDRFYNLPAGSTDKVCSGRRYITHGFLFAYIDN